ncbi:DUF3857 domain-containing protein [Olleya marilimosa]|uniref:DUF3857 domain-containing protein n=1 Tax=Olleya marilimosa TaxID=272164 RepID=UPI000486ABC0|nr:DUF3857 domain-containing protein [Olleya marilimosa]
MSITSLFKSIFFILFFSVNTFAQDTYQALLIDSDLKKNANAIIRSSHTEITIDARDKLITKQQRVVTVLNKYGQKHEGAYVYYDDSKSIKTLEAVIYDAFGKEVKKYKKRDFLDLSVADGVSIFNDNRAKRIDYTPSAYPYTIVFNLETISTNTAFLPQWYPIEGYHVSTEHSSVKIINNSEIQLSFKETNLEDFKIEKPSEFYYEAKNISALSNEAYSPSFTQIVPSVKFALKQFSMESVAGENTDWNEFGKWINDKLIAGTQDLPETVKLEILNLTADAKTPLDKAKIVYNYMQNKTRYISVQIGIGGWKPMLASDVDRLGYGDCKGLSNYTKALLDVVGVQSYYTIVYGDSDIRDIDATFSSLQGNHAILSIPDNDSYITLECTSQTVPFGYNANFTDDRDVLIVTPTGGQIVHTKAYATNENSQITKATVNLDISGNINAKINIKSKGTQYSKYRRLEAQTEKENILDYKAYFDGINNIQITNLLFNNDKDSIEFEEQIALNAKNYAKKAGNRLLFEPNLFNKSKNIPPKYANRKLPFKIDRGFVDIDQYTIVLPNNLKVEALQEDVTIKNKFGEYQFSITKTNENTLVYNRTLTINKGDFNKEDYKAYRLFRAEVAKHDASKIVLQII